MSETRQTLRELSRQAVEASEGSIARAQQILDELIREHNDVELERELTRPYRTAALLGLVSRVFADMRVTAAPPPAPRESEAASPPSQTLVLTEQVEPSPRHLLDTFLVAGKPLGDCTREEIEPAIKARKRDVRFMEEMIAGLPPGQAVRIFRTEDEAVAAYDLASAEADELVLVLNPEAQEAVADESEPRAPAASPDENVGQPRSRRRGRPPGQGPPK